MRHGVAVNAQWVSKRLCLLIQGCNWVILRWGRWYIYDRKDEIIYGLGPSVKCVAPLFRDISLAKLWHAGGGAYARNYTQEKWIEALFAGAK